jgi:trimethylamine monooxygenase
MGRFTVPPQEQMAEHDAMMCAKCDGLEEHLEGAHGAYDHACISFQGDYLKELIELTDIPSWDVEEVKLRWFEWEDHKDQGIMTFRDNSYKSVMTGNVAPPLLDKEGKPLLWKDAMLETCESYGMWDMYDGNVRKA